MAARRCGPVVYGYLFARVGGDEAAAEDLLQETLLEAVRGAPAFRGESAVSTWLCAIARRRLARYYETERRAEVARGSLRLVDNHLAAGLGADLVERQDEVVQGFGPPAGVAAPGPRPQVPGGDVGRGHRRPGEP